MAFAPLFNQQSDKILMKYMLIIFLFLGIFSTKALMTEDSLAGVPIGMPISIVLSKFPNYAVESNFNTTVNDCYYLRSSSSNTGIDIMIVNNIVVRIDIIENSKVATNQGIGISSSKSEVIKAYPQLIAKTHPYLGQAGQYLTVKLPSGNSIVFETAFDVVTEYRLGRDPEVSYIEGCN